jgi:outer membrane protein TolC
MTKPLYQFLLASLLLTSIGSNAEEMTDLPAPSQVNQALEQHLRVLEAENNLRAELANQQIRNSGSHEFNLRAGSAQRRIANPGQQLKEWDVALERPFRLPNKIFIDQDIGTASVAAARAAVGDARHEVGRNLLQLWFDLLRAHAQSDIWVQQLRNLRQQQDIVEKHYRAGDAPKIELNQAETVAAQAALALTQQQLREQSVALTLKANFPAIDTRALPETGTPQTLTGSADEWRQRILADNHELEMAQEQARAQQLLANRARADRLADPTLGIRHANEMGGNEKVTGVYVSIPFSFGQRGAAAEAATQQANIALDRAAFVQRRLESDIESAWLRAQNAFQSWEYAKQAAEIAQRNAKLSSKAYELGELSLTEALNAGRLAMDAQLAERLTRLDANETRYRLLLDAHELWQGAHEDHQ